MAQKPQQTLDNLMMACADLSGPGKGSSFKGPPVKDIKVHSKAAAGATESAFRQSTKARDWTSLAQNLEEAFSANPAGSKTKQQQPFIPAGQQLPPHAGQRTLQPPKTSFEAQDAATDDFGDFQSCHPPPPPLPPKSLPVPEHPPPASSGSVGVTLDDDFADFVAARPIINPSQSGKPIQPLQQHQPLPPQQPLPPKQPPPVESHPGDDFGSFNSSSASPAIPEFANFTKTPGVAPLLPAAASPSPLDAAKPNITANFNFEIFQSASSPAPPPKSGPASLPPVLPAVMAPPMLPSSGGIGGAAAGDKYGALRDVFSVEAESPSTEIGSGTGTATATEFGGVGANTEPGTGGGNGAPMQNCDEEDDFGDFIDARQASRPPLTSTMPNNAASAVFMPQTVTATGPISSSAAAANVIPWHSNSPPPPPLPDEEDEKEATKIGFPSDLSGVASEIGGFGGGDGVSTTALEESPSVPGMSSLATFDNDDFYSQVDLAQQQQG